MSAGLSKTRLHYFLQCPKRLWLEVNSPESKDTAVSSDLVFAQGHAVGDVARSLHPGGRLIENDSALSVALTETSALLAANERIPLFESTFSHDGLLIRIDVMEPIGDDAWNLIEVKSGASVKETYVDDIAIQRWVLERLGIDVASHRLAHVNTAWVYEGDGDYAGLLTEIDLTPETTPLQERVAEWVVGARATLAGPEPSIAMSEQCSRPYPCPFHAHCKRPAEAQIEFPVTLLPGGSGKALARELLADGFADLRSVRAERMPEGELALIQSVTACGQPHLNPDAVREIDRLPWPRAYLDFETISLAVPRWKGTRPYEQVPFQWSCHFESSPGQIEHHEFLDISGTDPRPACAQQLVDLLDRVPVILAYHAGFEHGRLRELAAAFPNLAGALTGIGERLFDLLPVVRCNYYHPEMRGSRSLKSVLPTVLGFDPYASLDGVKEGSSAQWAYWCAIQPKTPELDQSRYADQLRRYCAVDSWAMIAIAKFLESKPIPRFAWPWRAEAFTSLPS